MAWLKAVDQEVINLVQVESFCVRETEKGNEACNVVAKMASGNEHLIVRVANEHFGYHVVSVLCQVAYVPTLLDHEMIIQEAAKESADCPDKAHFEKPSNAKIRKSKPGDN